AEAALIFAAAVPTVLFLPAGPSRCGFLSEREQCWLQRKSAASEEDKREESETLAEAKGEANVLGSLLLDYRIVIMCVTRLLRTVAGMGMMFFSPHILVEQGLSQSRTALSMSLMVLASILLGQFWASHSDASGERIWCVRSGRARPRSAPFALC
ncbi:MAG: hypothetical protein VX463_19105, partial [Pseudomonadota bacterium]|nr:hypothetical protein [Pseudomonadota bacterium]